MSGGVEQFSSRELLVNPVTGVPRDMDHEEKVAVEQSKRGGGGFAWKDDIKSNRHMDALETGVRSGNVMGGGNAPGEFGRTVDDTSDMSEGFAHTAGFQDDLQPKQRAKKELNSDAGAVEAIPNRPVEGMRGVDLSKRDNISDSSQERDINSIPAPEKADLGVGSVSRGVTDYGLDDSLQSASKDVLKHVSEKEREKAPVKKQAKRWSVKGLIDQDEMLGIKNKPLSGNKNPNTASGNIIPPRDHEKDHLPKGTETDPEQDRLRNSRYVQQLQHGGQVKEVHMRKKHEQHGQHVLRDENLNRALGLDPTIGLTQDPVIRRAKEAVLGGESIVESDKRLNEIDLKEHLGDDQSSITLESALNSKLKLTGQEPIASTRDILQDDLDQNKINQFIMREEQAALTRKIDKDAVRKEKDMGVLWVDMNDSNIDRGQQRVLDRALKQEAKGIHSKKSHQDKPSAKLAGKTRAERDANKVLNM